MPTHSEARGLLALLSSGARTRRRAGGDGELLTIEEQIDRGGWAARSGAGRPSCGRRPRSVYVLDRDRECHATAPTAAATRSGRIVAHYDELLAIAPSPVVELNRAIAVGMLHGPEAGLAAIDELASRVARLALRGGDARADLLERAGRLDEAAAHYRLAAADADARDEQAQLHRRLATLGTVPSMAVGDDIVEPDVVTWHHGSSPVVGELQRRRTRNRVLPPVRQAGQPALDVACGAGRLLVPWVEAALDVDGVDASADMIAACRDAAQTVGCNPACTSSPCTGWTSPDGTARSSCAAASGSAARTTTIGRAATDARSPPAGWRLALTTRSTTATSPGGARRLHRRRRRPAASLSDDSEGTGSTSTPPRHRVIEGDGPPVRSAS